MRLPGPSAPAARAAPRAARPAAPRPMLAGPGAGWPWQRRAGASHSAARRGIAVSAMFGFNWPWGGGDKGEKKEGKFDSILNAARTARRGCPLAPKEAPEGLKLATFAGGCFWGLELAYQVGGVETAGAAGNGRRQACTDVNLSGAPQRRHP